MKTEIDWEQLKPEAEPHWYLEAEALVRKALDNDPLLVSRAAEKDSQLAQDIAAFKKFEKTMVEQAQDLLDSEPAGELIKKFYQGAGVCQCSLLHSVALFMDYAQRGCFKSPADKKQRFFSSLLSDDDSVFHNLNPDKVTLEDAYAAFTQETDDPKFLAYMLDLYVHFDDRLAMLEGFLRDLVERFKKNVGQVWSIFERGIASYKASDFTQIAGDVLTGVHLDVDVLYISIIMPNGASFTDIGIDPSVMTIGMLALDIMKQKADRMSIPAKANLLKILGDPVRYQLLLACKEEELYLSELARLVDLKPSTVSYHLNSLVSVEMLKVSISEEAQKRPYFRLNPKPIQELRDQLDDLL